MPIRAFLNVSSEVGLTIGGVTGGVTGVVAGGVVFSVVFETGLAVVLVSGVLPGRILLRLNKLDLLRGVEAKYVGRSLESWLQRQSKRLLPSKR